MTDFISLFDDDLLRLAVFFFGAICFISLFGNNTILKIILFLITLFCFLMRLYKRA